MDVAKHLDKSCFHKAIEFGKLGFAQAQDFGDSIKGINRHSLLFKTWNLYLKIQVPFCLEVSNACCFVLKGSSNSSLVQIPHIVQDKFRFYYRSIWTENLREVIAQIQVRRIKMYYTTYRLVITPA